MSYFIFNDYNSSDDLIITSPVIRLSWSQEMSEFATGSTSKVIQFSRSYGNSPIEISAVIKNTSAERLRTLYSAVRGFGKLVISGNPDEYINAVASVLQPVATAMTMAEIDITFTLLPFAYALNPTIAELTGDYTKIINGSTVFSAPEIRFTPTSAGAVVLDVNGALFIVEVPENLANVEIIVDCDAEVTYFQDGENKISINDITFGNYPLLTTGEVFVRCLGNVAKSSINVRERWY
ncbi:MAG: hypothetical protein NC340_08955 [Ruminococcus flavefaciens]|nr:hypothetical protein [Ruminococcus flavefaciens]MCM1232667.1 hypothetical protein [Ruminococcus flavefaciens]